MVVYRYSEFQFVFDEMAVKIPNISFVEAFPGDLYSMLDGCENSIVVLDDLMSECSGNQRVLDLFTKDSHHRGIKVMYITRTINQPGQQLRTISLNSHDMVVLLKPCRSLEITKLANQMFPTHGD